MSFAWSTPLMLAARMRCGNRLHLSAMVVEELAYSFLIYLPAGLGRIMSLNWRFAFLFVVSLGLASNAAPAADGLLWFAAGRPSQEARQAVEILVGAGIDGLDPGDYQAETLHRAVVLASDGPVSEAQALADLDGKLTVAMQRYLADLHFGRIDPRKIHENFAISPPGQFDPAAYLRAAVREHRLPDAVKRAAPPIPLYANLRRALARYRELVGHPAWLNPLPSFPGRKLEAGKTYAGLAVLTDRLLALGDLPPGALVPDRYEGAVVDGIKAFQGRHGLEPDGVIGKATLENLDVPPTARQRQIELTLERLRWTPLLQEKRMIVINIPEFALRAYETRDGRINLKATMKVIVGEAMNRRTPIFDEVMRFIEFSPYWNVPPSIARKETVPKLRRDPGYFDQQGFEFVSADGRVVTTLTQANLDAVLGGDMRIRQRPGPKNALGDIKFVFPNNDQIYLHHTPVPRLFSRDRRDFSHGCIRIEEPVALAKFVLQDEPLWTEERIRDAMAKGESATLRLQNPTRVVIAYSTVIVKNEGRVFFFPDIYGHDKLLDKALRLRSAMGAASHARDAGARSGLL